jgi:DNA primase
MSVTEIVEHLSARRNGQGWQAKCPAHQDHEPSLSIKEGPDGRTLFTLSRGVLD